MIACLEPLSRLSASHFRTEPAIERGLNVWCLVRSRRSSRTDCSENPQRQSFVSGDIQISG